ncbi:MAG TPA: hypothetical protein VFZ65_04205 [Planctomycetota bacterium]|nr:hypothetical protein [Planctomycetota bacterium]
MTDALHVVARLTPSSIRAGVLGLLAAGISPAHDCLRSQAPIERGQEQERRSAKPRMVVDEATDTMSFSMAGGKDMALTEFLEWGQAVTGKRFTFSPEELSAGDGDDRIALLGTLRIQRERLAEDFFSFFRTMLYTKWLTIVPRGEGDHQTLEIVNINVRARQAAPPQNTGAAHPHMAVDKANDTIRFSMDGSKGMDLIEFVEWAQEVTGKRFTFNRKELRGTGVGDNTISFRGTFQMGRKRFAADFFSFFQTMLHIKGFAVVRRGEGDLETFEIVKATANAEPLENTEGPPVHMVVDEAHDTVSFSMDGSKGMDLIEFIEWAQKVTGKRFTFSRKNLLRDVAGGPSVTVLGTFRIERTHFVEDFFMFFETVLLTKGLAVTPRGEGELQVFHIVPMADAR